MALPYSIKSDILGQLPDVHLAQLTDDVNGTVTNDAIVTSRILKADVYINSYIRGKNTTPGDPVATPLLKSMSVDIAIYYLYERRTNLQTPKPVKQLFDDATKQLELIRDGKIQLDDATSFNNVSGMYQGNGVAKGCIFTTNAQGTGVLDQYYNGPALNPNIN